ncbi:hypothetical protein B0H11DRAFT_1915847 [Mycena galericulata]|nr:hypothetical protein B0H11DRAFT_1915847 [Mycena galericulata]
MASYLGRPYKYDFVYVNRVGLLESLNIRHRILVVETWLRVLKCCARSVLEPGKMGNFKFARARTLKIGRARLPNSHGAEHAVRAKYVDRIQTSKSRTGIPKKGRNMLSAQNLLTGSNWQNRARGDQKRQVCGAGSNVCGAGINVHPDRHTREFGNRARPIFRVRARANLKFPILPSKLATL